jgi:hypothetical protein
LIANSIQQSEMSLSAVLPIVIHQDNVDADQHLREQVGAIARGQQVTNEVLHQIIQRLEQQEVRLAARLNQIDGGLNKIDANVTDSAKILHKRSVQQGSETRKLIVSNTSLLSGQMSQVAEVIHCELIQVRGDIKKLNEVLMDQFQQLGAFLTQAKAGAVSLTRLICLLADNYCSRQQLSNGWQRVGNETSKTVPRTTPL